MGEKMNWLKKLFNKEKEVESKDIIEDVQEEQEDIKETPRKISDTLCEHCGMKIFKEQKIKTYNGKKYHLKPCFRNLMKSAKQMSKGCL